jgi:Na+/H+-dicarboxylate symporter
VTWVLAIAPVGVFVLALNIALNTGLQTAGVLFQAMLVMVLAPTAGIAFAYLVARIGGGVSFVRFARAAIGPQAVAAGTTSSMATLPALIEAAEKKLDVPPALAGSVLPLAVSTFRFGNVLIVMCLAIFAAHAVGHDPTLVELTAAGVAAILTNIGIPGLPAIAVLYAADAPAFQAMGAPLELLPLLIAISAPSDIMDTVCNVTADLAATTVVQRWLGAASPATELAVGA